MSEKSSELVAKIFFIVGCIVIVGAIFIYSFHGHIIPFNDVDKEYFGIIGDFIGGVAGTLFTIVATILIWMTFKSQRAELRETQELFKIQHKPSLQPLKTNISVYTKNELFGYTHEDTYSFKEDHFLGTDTLVLKMVNLGLGVASSIKIQWYCNLFMVSDFLAKADTDGNVSLNSNTENFRFDYKRYDIETAQHWDSISRPLEFDFLWPEKELKGSIDLIIPILYIDILMITIRASFEKRDQIFENHFNPVEFPPLYLLVECTSQLGEKVNKLFRIYVNPQGMFNYKDKADEFKTTQLEILPKEINYIPKEKLFDSKSKDFERKWYKFLGYEY